jgi:hypothetical protein
MPCPALVVQVSECGLVTFRHLVELLTGKVKHFSYSFSLQEAHGSRTEQRILGEGRGKNFIKKVVALSLSRELKNISKTVVRSLPPREYLLP